MKIKKEDRRQVLFFGIIGVIGFIANYFVLSSLQSTIVKSHLISETIAAVMALQLTFLLHNTWTYKITQSDRAHKYKFKTRYFAYILSNLTGSAITIISYANLATRFENLLALSIAAITGMVWNFFANRLYIWKHIQVDLIEMESK